jgi:ABC-2 type transport system permease protein
MFGASTFPRMTLASEIAVLGRVHWRSFRAKARHTASKARLLSGTILFFLLGYLVAGYFMFCRGLEYMMSMPGVGHLLTERIIYMVYFFFMLMLVFSNSILLYSGLFRGKETAWLLTTPVSPRAIFLWKLIESFIVSSWGLAILSAPLLASIGHTFGAGPMFYVKCAAVSVPLLLLPSGVAGLLVAGLVRYWGRTMRWVLLAAAALLVWRIADGLLSPVDLSDMGRTTNLHAGFKKVLGFTNVAMNRFLPSAWMSEMILHWSHGYEGRGIFYSLVLLSWVGMVGLVCTAGASRVTHTAWNLSQWRRAERTGRRRRKFNAEPQRAFGAGLLDRVPFLPRRTAALIRKDLREFARDPAQWIPCAIVFSLLLLYASNLSRAASAEPRFRLVLSGLNFGVCSLTLSTLTTRFIFPMFSLEGRRLWILGLSPVGMSRVFRQKLLLFSSMTGGATCLLMFVSGVRLGMNAAELAYYCGGIVLMSTGLNALALSLGVLFPNFHDASPARIVSGFGGTLCLILNFIFIISFLAIFLWPFMTAQSAKTAGNVEQIRLLAAAGVCALTSVAAGVPIIFSLRRMKKLELLGNL